MPGKKEDFEASRSWWLEHRDLLDLVGSRERVIVTVYYGLDGDEPVTLAEAGRRIEVGQERARQLRNFAKAMAKRILEMNSTRRKIYEACLGTFGVPKLLALERLGLSDDAEYLGAIFGELIKAGIDDPEKFLRSYGVLEPAT